jgi:hypothetical protein
MHQQTMKHIAEEAIDNASKETSREKRTRRLVERFSLLDYNEKGELLLEETRIA